MYWLNFGLERERRVGNLVKKDYWFLELCVMVTNEYGSYGHPLVWFKVGNKCENQSSIIWVWLYDIYILKVVLFVFGKVFIFIIMPLMQPRPRKYRWHIFSLSNAKNGLVGLIEFWKWLVKDNGKLGSNWDFLFLLNFKSVGFIIYSYRYMFLCVWSHVII